LDFLCKERRKEERKIGVSHQKSAASGGQLFPDSLGNFQCFLNITFYSPPSRRNFQNSGSPNDEQVQFISKRFNTFGFSLSGSIFCFSLSIFQEFLSAFDGKPSKITDTNFTELDRLCKEFGFSELAAKLSDFHPSIDFKKEETEDADARGRIAPLEETANQHSHVISMLEDKVIQLSTDFGRL
jgi:hypothetical protein